MAHRIGVAPTARARGFTLIELLVVIAIVAMLVGMLLPALGSARDSAWSVQCTARMRTLAQASSFYADDHDDEIPRSKHSVGFSGTLPWAPALFRYVTGRAFGGDSGLWQDPSWWSATNEHYRCPHDRRESPVERPGLPFKTAALSYALNVYYELEMGEIDPGSPSTREPFKTRARVPRPSSTVLLADLDADLSTDHIMAHFWTRGVPAGHEVATDRHGDGTGFVYLDAHARTAPFGRTYDASSDLDAWNPAAAR